MNLQQRNPCEFLGKLKQSEITESIVFFGRSGWFLALLEFIQYLCASKLNIFTAGRFSINISKDFERSEVIKHNEEKEMCAVFYVEERQENSKLVEAVIRTLQFH